LLLLGSFSLLRTAAPAELNAGFTASGDRFTELYANVFRRSGFEGDGEAWNGMVALVRPNECAALLLRRKSPDLARRVRHLTDAIGSLRPSPGSWLANA
jgi:hypothetical protein